MSTAAAPIPVYRSAEALYSAAKTDQDPLAKRNASLVNIDGTEALKAFGARALSDDDFTDPTHGSVAPTTNQKFFKWVREHKDNFMAGCTIQQMKSTVEKVPGMFFGAPVTRGDDGTAATYLNKPAFGAATTLTAKEFISDIGVRWNTDFAQIDFGSFKTELLNMVVTRWMTDMKLALWRSDATAYASLYDRFGMLLKVINGWAKQLENKRRISAAGSLPTIELLEALYRESPDYVQEAEGLSFAAHKCVPSLYRTSLLGRGDAIGEAAFKGLVPAPIGLSWNLSSAVPIMRSLTSTVATAGYHVCPTSGPFQLDNTHKNVKININAIKDMTIDLLGGSAIKDALWPSDVAYRINYAFENDVAYGAAYANVAREREGKVVITSPTTGGASTVNIAAVANSAYVALGFVDNMGAAAPPAATGTGTGAASGGTSPVGTVIVLTPPSNFVVGIVGAAGQDLGTRIASKYEQDTDEFQTVMRTMMDVKYANPNAVTYLDNVKAFVS